MVGTVRNKIPTILSQRGMSKSDFQRATGLSFPTVFVLTDSESDELNQKTQIGTLVKVCEALGVSISDLVEIKPDAA